MFGTTFEEINCLKPSKLVWQQSFLRVCILNRDILTPLSGIILIAVIRTV